MAECPDCGCKLAQAFCPGCGRDMRGSQDARRPERTPVGHEPRGWARGARKVAEIEGVSPFQFHPDGRHLVTAGPDLRDKRLWTLYQGAEVGRIRLRDSGVGSLSVSPDGKYLAVHDGGFETQVSIWDLDSRSPIWHGSWPSIGPVVFSPDGGFLAVGHDGHTVIFAQAPLGPELEPYQRQMDTGLEGACLVFSQDGKFLITGTAWTGGGYGEVWSVRSARPTAKLPDLNGPVTSAAFSQCGRFLATGELNGPARLWAVGTWESLGVIGDQKTTAVTFTADSRSLVVGPRMPFSDCTCVELWSLESRSLVLRLGEIGELMGTRATAWMSCFAVSPDGLTLAGTYANLSKVLLCEVATGEPMYDISWIDIWEARCKQVGFSPTGRYLVVACEDGMSRIYEQSE